MCTAQHDLGDTVGLFITRCGRAGDSIRTIDHLGAGELGVRGDTVDFRQQRLVLGIQHGAFGAGKLARTGLNGQRLHAQQDVVDLGHCAVGDLKHGDRLSRVDRGLLEADDLRLQPGTNGERGRVVLGGQHTGTGRKLGKGRGCRRVGHGQVALGNIGGEVRN